MARILDISEFEQEFGLVEQPKVTSDDDYRARLGGSFLKTLVSPIRSVGEIANIDLVRNLGENIEGGIDAAFPIDQKFYNGIDRDLVSGAGSMAGFMVPGAAVGAGPKVGALLAAGLGMSSQGLSQLDEARQMDATQEQQRKALLQGTALGSFEGVPIGRVFGRAAPAAHEIADTVSGFLLKVAKEGAKGAAEEAAQEGITQLGSNIIASDLAGYDPNRDATKDVAYNALLGALLGGPVSGVAATYGQDGNRVQPQQPQALQGDVLPPEPKKPSGSPQLGITPMTIDGEVIQPQPKPAPGPTQESATNQANSMRTPESAANSANSMRNTDLSKPLDGEVEILIDNGDGETVPGFWHERSNSVREKGGKPSDAVLASQPKQQVDNAETSPEQSRDIETTNPQQMDNVDPTLGKPLVDGAENAGIRPENQTFLPAPNQPSAATPRAEGTGNAQIVGTELSPENGNSRKPQGRIEGQQPPTTANQKQEVDKIPGDQGAAGRSALVDSIIGSGTGASGQPEPGNKTALVGNDRQFRPYTPDEAAQAGAQAFEAGKERRMPADMDPSDSASASAWYKSWDRANLAAPVPDVSTPVKPDAGQPQQSDAGPKNEPPQAKPEKPRNPLGQRTLADLLAAITEEDVAAAKQGRPIAPEPEQQADKNIGREWNSEYGKQKIVARDDSPSGALYDVQGEDGAIRRYSVDKIEEVIRNDEYRLTPEYEKERAESAETDRLRQERDTRAQDEKRRVESEIKAFADAYGLSPMQAGKARDALQKSISRKGKVTTIKGMIEDEVAAGATVSGSTTGRRLSTGDDTFLDQKATTKIGMDYAEYLISKKDAPKPEVPEPAAEQQQEAQQSKQEEPAQAVEEQPPAGSGKTELTFPMGKAGSVTVEGVGEPIAGITEQTPHVRAARRISGLFDEVARGDMSMARMKEQLREIVSAEYGGTASDGAFSSKDGYEALELGFNMYLANNAGLYNPADGGVEIARARYDSLSKMLDSFPRQRGRDADTDAFQQFSTPPQYAFAAAWFGNIRKGDTILEPSAGNGGIAVFAKNAGARVIVNEIDKRRLDSLGALGFDRVYSENAEQINNILPKDVQADVVLMNPPFGSSGVRNVKEGAELTRKHIDQALKRLKPGGRLVAITGHTFTPGNAKVKKWFADLAKTHNIRFGALVDGKEYGKFGTTYDTRLWVIDNTGPTTEKPKIGSKAMPLESVFTALEDIRNDRSPASKQPSVEPAVQEPAETGGRNPGSDADALPAPVAVGSGERGNQRNETGPNPVQDSDRGDGSPATRIADAVDDGGRGGQPAGNRNADSQTQPNGDGGISDGGSQRKTPRSDGLTLEQQENAGKSDEDLTESIFANYRPQRVRIKDARPHPTKLVQSSAMASVLPPKVDYTPQLPEKSIKDGLLSDAQLENIIYAGAAHSEMLPTQEGEAAYRKGYFIGDGTGVGKGRQISGIILDNIAQGRKKHVWISEKWPLFEDAKRDLEGAGGDPSIVFSQEKMKRGSQIKNEEGVLFTTYSTIKSTWEKPDSNFHQLVEWLGKDFDGVIAFDEAHNMGNAVAMKGKRGTTKPSQTAMAGVALQEALPNARIVYVSATGATEVSNLSYASRLGLWGFGTPFASREKFITEVTQGGVAAMELVARDIKAMGSYQARSLSYDGVSYSKLEHKITGPQREIYDTLATAWQTVLQNVNEALKVTGGAGNSNAKSSAMAQFWGSHQRFFNQVLTALQVPSVIKQVESDLAAGESVVMQIVNTNEASTERQLGKVESQSDLDDLDITPRDMLMGYIEASFPVAQHEEYVDENGNKKSRPVLDSNGNPVDNVEAVAMREALLDKLATIRVPESPLDAIIDHFGEDKVAEVTGRSRRIISKGGKRSIQKRGKNANKAEADAFMAGDKDILIFSDAGGTGRSYHASLDHKNQKRRKHYMLQPGWRADKAVQGFGRTHRTNQASAPHYYTVSTDIQGHKRFVSSIARRLDQLGALTKGQRDTGSQGMFTALDNLESDFAKDAMSGMFQDIARGNVPGIDLSTINSEMGLKLIDAETGAFLPTNIPDIPKFLNRLLSMTIDSQNRVFDEFVGRLEANIEAAKERGDADLGIETIKADKTEKLDDRVVFTEPKSGAETRFVEVKLSRKNHPTTWQQISTGSLTGKVPEKYAVNKRSGAIYAMVKAPSRTDRETGNVVPTYRRHSPMSNNLIDRSDVDGWGSGYEIVDEVKAQEAWEKAIEEAPEYRTQKVNMIVGAILPIWDRLPKGEMRIYRMKADDGEVLLGRVIKSGDVAGVLQNLGATGKNYNLSPTDVKNTVMAGGTVTLSNGWRLMRRRINNENRIEVMVRDPWAEKRALEQTGLIMERIEYRARYFVPIGGRLESVVKNLLTGRDIVMVDEPGASLEEAPRAFHESSDEARDRKRKELEYDRTGRHAYANNEFFVPANTRPGNAAKDYVIAMGKRTGTEHLVAIDENGVVQQDTEGLEKSVSITKELEKLISDPSQNIVVHHNHPSSYGFSKVDIAMLSHLGMTGIYAHGNNGKTHFATLSPRTRSALLQNYKATDAWKKLYSVVSDADKYAVRVLNRAIIAETLHYEMANDWHPHLVSQILHEVGVIQYEAEIPDAMLNHPMVKEFLGQVAEEMQERIRSVFNVAVEPDKSNDGGYSTVFRQHPGIMGEAFEGSGSDAGQRNQQTGTAQTGPQGHFREDENRLTAPVFYSEVLRATNGISQNKAQPAQWLAMIRKAPGVKQEEIEWLGLEEWLGSQTGAVTKDQVQDFIRANQITVQEVEKGGQAKTMDAIARDLGYAGWNDLLTDEQKEQVEDVFEAQDGNFDAKYSSYTLPGGQNYKELLLTLPAKDGPFGAAAAEAYTRLSNELHKKYGNGIRLKATPEELAKLDDLNDRAIGKGGNYQSSHWDEPNVLAHVRFSERMQEIPLTEDEKAANIKRAEMVAEYNRLNDKLDKARHAVAAERQPIMERIRREVFEDAKAGKFPAGRMNEEENKRLDGALSDDTSAVRAFRAAEKQAADFWRSMPQEIKNRAVRALHIEEIQSDWHQAGRKKGYAGRKIDTSKWSASKFGVSAWAVSDHTGRVINALEFGETAEEAIANTALTKSEMAVPHAPFKTTWPELAFKRMLRYAVDNGFDRIVWTPGDVQADRFDLSKQVDSIAYQKNADGTYKISAKHKGSTYNQLLGESRSQDELAEYVGKELAEKIVNGEGVIENWAANNEPRNEWHVFRGVDLKVGGEGMRGFYDNILPKTVQKMVKKWGGKVETSKILEDKKPTSPLEQVPFDPDNVPGGQQVWSLDITEDMRTAAMEGLALFEDDAAFSEPSTQNWTVPKRGTFEVLFKGNGRLLKRLQHAKSAEAVGASIDNWRVKFQDRFLPMLRVEQAIEEHRGEALPEEMKVYAAEELYTGRAGSRLDRIQRRYMEPVASIMRKNSITQEEIGEYLYARHAKERNARIAEINPKMPDGGSGMKNADAAAKLAEFEARDDSDAFKMIGKMVDRMLRESVRFRVESGLLSQQAADAWQKYQHYVPLRGWEEVDESSEPGMPNTGKGFTAQGKESRMALGRSSRAGDILATAYSVAHEAVIRGEKNRVVQRLYDLAKANPNKQYWEINPVRMIRVFNRATGMVTERPESPIFAKDANKTVSAKFKGVEHRIVIHDPELAEAIKRLNAEDLNGMLKFLIGVNRYLSTMNTSLNPEFLVSNALRDVQTASVVMATKGEKGLTKAVLKDYRVALAGSWGGLRGKSLSTEWRRWFNEYDRAGGKIAFYKMETIGDLRNEVEKSARQLSAKDYRTVWRGMKAVGQFIEDANLAVDNALRLALYKNLRERGYTQDQAASAAKNLTVNFNRRGQYGVTVNALYLFANAGIQGSAVVINSLKHRRARQMVGAMTAGSFALTIANIMLLGLDDDNGESEYSKLLAEKEWELQRNLVVMLPGRREDGGQNYAKFPLPYGYNLFHAIGRKMAEVAMGLEDTAGALKDTAVTFIDAFNPIGGTDSIAKLISPTVIDPFIEMSENADFAGRKIRPERDKYDRYMPKSQDYYGSVSPISRHLAAMLNEWTGGNEFKPGAVDVSPEWIDHYAKFLGGAASATLWRPVNTATKLVRGEEVTTNDVPFLRRVHGATGSYIDRSLFYSRVDEIQSAHAQTDGFRKKGDRESFEALDKRTKLLGSMYSKGFRDMMNRMKEIRLARNEIYAAPLAAAERSARLKKLDEAENRVVQAFNKAYLRTVAKSRE